MDEPDFPMMPLGETESWAVLIGNVHEPQTYAPQEITEKCGTSPAAASKKA